MDRYNVNDIFNLQVDSIDLTPLSEFAGFQVTLIRDNQTKLFVFGLPLIPGLFALLFVDLLFLNPATKGKGPQDLLVALVGAVLAVLPLKAVLVPSAIADLTLVDSMLGIGVGVLVLVAFASYASDQFARHGRKPSYRNGSHSG